MGKIDKNEESKNNVKKRNVPYEVIMVIAGTFLIIISYISIHLDLNTLLDQDQKEVISKACNSLDEDGNYSNDSIECINDICYFSIDDTMMEASCIDNKVNYSDKLELDNAKEKSNMVISLCNNIDENGLYLNQNDDYCFEGKCYLKDNDKEYRAKCPNVISVNETDDVPDSYKTILKSMCENYNRGEVVKEELVECIYGSCNITEDKENPYTYSLQCNSEVYRIYAEDQFFDNSTINKYLEMACNNDQISEERFNENIRCSKGICSIHYKQDDYFKKCDK